MQEPIINLGKENSARMIQKTQALVLRQIKFKEHSLILHILTRDYGYHTFIVNGVRKKNSNQTALYQLGQILDIDFYHNPQQDIWRIKEANLRTVHHGVFASIVKLALFQYIIELSYHVIRLNHDQDGFIFQFIVQQLEYLETNQASDQTNRAVYFLWGMIDVLGLRPEMNDSNQAYFDLQKGSFTEVLPHHKQVLSQTTLHYLQELLKLHPDALHSLTIPKLQREQLLQSGHRFLQFHLDGFQEPEMPGIFQQLFFSKR